MYASDALLAGLLASLAAISIMAVIWYVILVIANWRVFAKAGEPGWKAIIPLYNSYILYKISWKPLMYWVILVLSIVSVVFRSFDSTALTVISYILNIAIVVVSVMQAYKLSKAFGHGVGYTIGLIFLNPIFMLILGFGSSQYVGNNNNQ